MTECKTADLALRKVYWASVSGGKDSLYMLKVILDNPQKYPLDGIVHFELDIDYPFIKDVIATMKEMVKPLGIPFRTYKPRFTFDEMYEKYGFPTRTARWCNKLKMDCLKQLTDDLKEYAQKPICYIGFCADEQKRFKDDIYPLAEEGIIEDTILEWAKDVEVFNGYYKENRRCGCYMCPLASINNDKYLLKYYPELFWDKMKKAHNTEIMRSKELGRKFCVWRADVRYDTEYRVQRIMQLLEKERAQ